MLHYIALIWDPADPLRQAAAQSMLQQFRHQRSGWKTGMEGPGHAILYCTGKASAQKSYFLHNGRGVIFGKLFPGRIQLDAAISTAIVDSCGRELLVRYWGEYVAFLYDPQHHAFRVLRDPTGVVPCQWTRAHGVDIYFTRIEDCEHLAPLSLSFNRHYLLGALLYDSVCVRETGFKEVETVLAGECIEHRQGLRTGAFLWNPLRIAESVITEDPLEATRLVHETVERCIHSWASCFQRIVLRLSGGLDSSIVLACLAEAPNRPEVVCIHDYTPNSAAADERAFAQSAATRAGVPLIENEPNPDFSLVGATALPRTLSPYPCIIDPAARRRRIEFMQTRQAGTVFTGSGGDEIFYKGGPLPTATDYMWRHGATSALLRIAMEDAAASQRSFWRTLRIASRYGWRRRPWHTRMQMHGNYRPLMLAAVREEGKTDVTLWHPLFQHPAQIPPAKYAQCYTFALSTASIHIPDPAEQLYCTVSPLLSQPLLELSLRLPTYVLKIGGRDRALARNAFKNAVPPEIIRRNTKGTGAEYLSTLVQRNLPFMRELLLDGYLVKNGFLDPVALEEALSDRPTSSQTYTLEVIDYLSVEAWIRNWTAAGRRMAA